MKNWYVGLVSCWIRGRHIRWELMGEDFWSEDFDAVRGEANKLKSGWVVVVLDPISFYDEDVREKIQSHLYLAFENPNAVLIALPPFPMLSPQQHFRDIIKKAASQVFDHFYPNKIIFNESRAYCNLNVADGLDIMQYMFTTVGCGIMMERNKPINAVLHM